MAGSVNADEGEVATGLDLSNLGGRVGSQLEILKLDLVVCFLSWPL